MDLFNLQWYTNTGWGQFFVLLVLLGLCTYLGYVLSVKLRLQSHQWRFVVVLYATLASCWICYVKWPPKKGIDLSGGVILIYEIDKSKPSHGNYTMEELAAAVGRRVNPAGLKEVTVRPYGTSQIEVVVPQATEGELNELKEIISQTGSLEFRILATEQENASLRDRAMAMRPADMELRTPSAEPGKEGTLIGKWVPIRVDEAINYRNDPASKYFLRDGLNGELQIFVLGDKYNVTGDYLTKAEPGVDENGQKCVNFGFDSKGANLFGQLTGTHLPKETGFKSQLAIILDNYLQSAPQINSAIYSNGQITGRFTEEEVTRLAAVLKAGKLPATLRKDPIQSLYTGPTLGADTVFKGSVSMAVATGCVVVFMLIYYRFAGLVANIALVLNILLTVAFMMLFNAAFTLAGLAGLALTVGMAVDANVLIYERMREELSRNATLRMAIRNGFDRATTTIIDGNVTTLIAAVVLYWIGTDQVKGFAVTLTIGIVMNLFTAITVSRLIFDVAEKNRWVTNLKMMKMMDNTNFDFIGKLRIAVCASLIFIGIGLFFTAVRGKGMLDIDFTGGVSIETLFKEPQNVGEIRLAVKDILPDVTVQDVNITTEKSGIRFLINTSQQDEMDGETIKKEAAKSVEEELVKVFGDKLAVNDLSWEALVQNPGTLKASVLPVDVKPGESTTPEGKPAEKIPPETKDSKAPEKTPAETKPADTKPAEEKPAAKTPVETKAPEKKEPESGVSEKKEPAKDDGAASSRRRFDLADEQLLAFAFADDPPVEKKAEPEPKKEPAETKSQTTEEKPAAKSEEKPAAEKPAATPAKAETGAPAATGAPTTNETASGAAAPIVDPFAGGTKTKLSFSQQVDHATIERLVKSAFETVKEPLVATEFTNPAFEKGSKKAANVWDAQFAMPPAKTALILDEVKKSLAESPYFPATNKIGGTVAGESRDNAIKALIASMLLILVYVWFRFSQAMFGLAILVALVHDVLVTLGALALSLYLANYLGFLQVEPFKINLTIVAAFLTIIGYSLNDTIVIFDRIREVRGKSPELTAELVNNSINQTLSRTLLTSLTVFIVVVILYFFGGQGIHGFAFAMVIGTISGTYSTVYVATPILIWFNKVGEASKSAKTSGNTVRAA